MNAHLRLTLVQAELAWRDPAANRRRLAGHFRGLAGHTDLVVLPEMFSTGFCLDAAELAEEMSGPTIGWMREEAVALGCVIAGSLIVREGGRFYNRFVWARPDGTLEHYDKRHLFRMAGEHKDFAAGERRVVIDLKGWRVCPLICYDLRFPVWSRCRDDYDLLIYVANWPQARAAAWATLLRARAIENLCYVAGVNRIGQDGNGTHYAGDSLALDFQGRLLSSEGGGDRVETVVFDLESLHSHRKDFPALEDADRYAFVD